VSQFMLAATQVQRLSPPYARAVFGGFLYAFGLNSILVANGLTEGGFAGLSTLLHFLFGTSVGLIYFVVNMPLLILALRFMGGSFLLKTVIGIGIVTASLLLTAELPVSMEVKWLASLLAGAMSGLGRGLMFRSGYTTGGVDIVAFIVHRFTRFPRAYTILAFDVAVMGLFAVYINIETALYSVLALSIGSQVLDKLTRRQ
jgi:uncharacterized membrane-anchored protein YitT (DUF2179 family)